MIDPTGGVKSKANAVEIAWECEAGGGGNEENQGSVTTPPQVQDRRGRRSNDQWKQWDAKCLAGKGI